MRQVIGMLGVKGSGKDTCAAILVNELGFVRIGFADSLYKEAAEAFKVTVEFLGNRSTKEKDLAQLSLQRCINKHFVEVALQDVTCSRNLRRAALDRFAGAGFTPHVSRRRVRTLLKAPRSPRFVLQLWGTEYRRKSKYGFDSYWLDQVRAAIDAQPARSFVITDVRFKNEANFVENINGRLVRVRRLALEEREEAERRSNGRAAHPSETELLGRSVHAELFNGEGELGKLRLDVLALLADQPAMKAA
ncbi:hypothetical protein D3C71_22840 [compost metagenome]